MRRIVASRHLVISAFAVALVCGLQAADRAEITFADGRIFPESLTSTKNGDLYFGSLGQDAVYRATPKSVEGEAWIQAEVERPADGARRVRRRKGRRAVGLRVGDRRPQRRAGRRRNGAQGVQPEGRVVQGQLSRSRATASATTSRSRRTAPSTPPTRRRAACCG